MLHKILVGLRHLTALLLCVMIGAFIAQAVNHPESAFIIGAALYASSFIPVNTIGSFGFALNAKDILFTQGSLNPGGIGEHIFYAFSEDIASWPAAIANVDPGSATTFAQLVEVPLADPFVMKTGKYFYKLYCTLEEGEVKWVQVGVRDSKSWENSTEISYPGNDSEVLGFLAAASNRKIVAIVPEMNGKLRVIGHPLFPAQIESVEGTSGKKVADGRATKIVIKASSGTPAPIYKAPLQLAPVV